MNALRRHICALMPLWFWGGLVWLALNLTDVIDLPPAPSVTIAAAFIALAMVRPAPAQHEPVEVAAPVTGRWVAVNSPATKTPSHGLRAYGQTYAIDILHPRPAGTRPRVPLLGGFRRPETFSTFGEPVLAMADGVVTGAVDGRRDHLSRSSWSALAYLMLVEGVRDLFGPAAVIGNHVVVDHGDGVHSMYAHLQRGTVDVAVGDRVVAGQQLAEVGSSGNASEPHLHVQLMDRPQPLRAAGIPFRWADVHLTDEHDGSWSRKEPAMSTTAGVPADFQVFEAGPPSPDEAPGHGSTADARTTA